MIEGGCFCNAVRYTIDGRLAPGRSCHCSRCRKAFSGASSAYAPLQESTSFAWTKGEENVIQYRGPDGNGLDFCGLCGSTLCGIVNGRVHGVTLGCVDGEPGVEIEMHLFVGSKAPWDDIDGDACRYEGFPPPDSDSSRS